MPVAKDHVTDAINDIKKAKALLKKAEENLRDAYRQLTGDEKVEDGKATPEPNPLKNPAVVSANEIERMISDLTRKETNLNNALREAP